MGAEPHALPLPPSPEALPSLGVRQDHGDGDSPNVDDVHQRLGAARGEGGGKGGGERGGEGGGGERGGGEGEEEEGVLLGQAKSPIRHTAGQAVPPPPSRRTPPTKARKLPGEKRQAGGAGSGGSGVGHGRRPAFRSAQRRRSSGVAPRPPPLLPVAERRAEEDATASSWRLRKGGTAEERWDITPDGGSAGREGRQFTVWNVGHNGRIYLRPTVRPAHQRYPQPHFVFPATPPGTAVPHDDSLASVRDDDADREEEGDEPRLVVPPSAGARHRRALSDSTLPDTSVARESDLGGFKIIITQPADDQRPRTLEHLDAARPPLLEVSIPSWRIGTPRFSMRGTPFIRGSSYAPTEECRSSSASLGHHDDGHLTAAAAAAAAAAAGAAGDHASSRAPSSSSYHHHGRGSPAPYLSPQLPRFHGATQPSPRLPPPLRATYLSTHLVIEPSMFDALTFPPDCDDRAVVRYAPATGAVTAATPPRLVAEITSPSFLDYDLLSDFFLTFRAFLEPLDLARMLFARLRWALAQPDARTGTVVRVRTFVALRHWILNYFADDFMPDRGLRVAFCDLLNELADELASGVVVGGGGGGGGGEGEGQEDEADNGKTKKTMGKQQAWIKILTELKKCWRRVCAQYWDDDLAADADASPEDPISPGGSESGYRESTLPPPSSSVQRLSGSAFPLPRLDRQTTSFGEHPAAVLVAGGGRGGPGDGMAMDPFVTVLDPRGGDDDEPRPRTPDRSKGREADGSGGGGEMLLRRTQTSPTSITSVEAISCSFPTKSMRFAPPTHHHPVVGAAHPADPAVVVPSADHPVATTPRALVGRRVRPQQPPPPQQQHKRNGSLSDSLREHHNNNIIHSNSNSSSSHHHATDGNNDPDVFFLASSPYAGNLVRGNVLPPGQPFVEVPPYGADGTGRETTLLFPPSSSGGGGAHDKPLMPSAMSGQGMRKLLGSVRRALSTRNNNNSNNDPLSKRTTSSYSPTRHVHSPDVFELSPLGPRGATANRLPGSAIVPQAPPVASGSDGARPSALFPPPPVRIDVLAAQIAEDFQRAVREDAGENAADAAAAPGETQPQQREQQQQQQQQQSMTFLDAPLAGPLLDPRPTSDAAITAGSQSIVIVDDTVASSGGRGGGGGGGEGGLPFMTGALPAMHASADGYADSFAQAANGADLTPPTTPPGKHQQQAVGNDPRGSSCVLGSHQQQLFDQRSSLSESSVFLPPFVPDLDTLGRRGVAVSSEDGSPRPSLDHAAAFASIDEQYFQQFPAAVRGHARTASSRSFVSHHLSLRQQLQQQLQQHRHRRRTSSFTSVDVSVRAPATVRSFDATTLSEGSIEETHGDHDGHGGHDKHDDRDDHDVDVPRPLRILRRRPGGDLRAAAHVGDLDLRQRAAALRRSRSVGSLTTYTESARSSSFVDVAAAVSSGDDGPSLATATAHPFSLGAMADPQSRHPSQPAPAAPAPRQHHQQQQHPHHLSLFSTHSSKPIMRPSFEAEAKKLAQIPDDLDDDGGVESALLKLEGRYEEAKKNRKKTARILSLDGQSAFATTDDVSRGSPRPPPPAPVGRGEGGEARIASLDKSEHRRAHVEVDHLLVSSPTLPTADECSHGRRRRLRESFLSASSSSLSSSGTSYCSIPLLERGLTDDGRASGKTTTTPPRAGWTDRSVLEGGSSDETTPRDDDEARGHPLDSQHPSYEFVARAGSVAGGERPEQRASVPLPPRPSTEQSFLDVDSDDGASDLSSELSAVVLDPKDGEGSSSFLPLPPPPLMLLSSLPAHPLGDSDVAATSPPPRPPPPLPSSPRRRRRRSSRSSVSSRPSSPPITLVQALHMSPPNMVSIPVVHDHQVYVDKALPPTPDTTPTTAATPYATKFGALPDSVSVGGGGGGPPPLEPPSPLNDPRRLALHLPFVLAFDSEVLAQQFTLIEKDALNEIDWRELIEMRWKHAEHRGINTRSWVSFLRDTDARGVEVVIARFNLVVKWAVSEVVLTRDLDERARCLAQLIRVAARCRRHRNFATASQLAVALTCNEVARLARTWARVPAAERAALRDLEALVSPTRNFYQLRKEMESGGTAPTSRPPPAPAGAGDGPPPSLAVAPCIPFVGIYTHDLLFTAQRPSEIASSPTTAPLVNFERCRMTASVVKTLLRLLEASTLYTFQPVEGLTERCLWMAALSDEEIRRHSEALE